MGRASRLVSDQEKNDGMTESAKHLIRHVEPILGEHPLRKLKAHGQERINDLAHPQLTH